MDFEEVQEDLSFAADMVGMAQRGETNRLLREQAAERTRKASLPDCPYCGSKIPKIGVKICASCKSELVACLGVSFRLRDATSEQKATKVF